MQYLFISVFIHVFLLACLVFINTGQDDILLKNNKKSLTVAIIPSAYKLPVVSKTVSKAKKVTRLFEKKVKTVKSKIVTRKITDSKSLEVVAEGDTPQNAEQVKQAQLSYVQKLKLYIEKNKHYPRQAVRLKQSGVVKLRLKISKDGVFSGVELIGSSDFPILDEAALKLINKIGKFNPLPNKIKPNSYFTLPIAYSLRR